jgi:ankyrin repeat protein
VQVLVELVSHLGASSTAVTHFGSTALHFAAVGGHVLAVQALLEVPSRCCALHHVQGRLNAPCAVRRGSNRAG